MNSHDKILLGLSCHARSKCSECPYEDMPECSSKLAADAGKMLKLALKDLNIGYGCETCAHYAFDEEDESSICADCDVDSNWQWRGAEVE